MNKLAPQLLKFFLFFLFTIFAVEASNAATEPQPSPLRFPQDHGIHPDTNLEWWNFYGHMLDSNDDLFGFTLTFMRLSAPPQDSQSQWTTKDIFVSYFTITDNTAHQFHYQEKINRTSFNFSGASNDNLGVWNRDWNAIMNNTPLTLQARTDNMALALHLTSVKPVLLFGNNGFFQISPSNNSNAFFYSLPRLEGEGELQVNSKKYNIVTAIAWMDHASQYANANTLWDKYVIQLNNNEEIMIFILTSKNSLYVQPSSFCIINQADGSSVTLPLADFQLSQLDTWRSPNSDTTYPSGWLLTIPRLHYRLTIKPSLKNQEIVTLDTTLWDGQAMVEGEKGNVPITGYAYVELSKQNSRSYTL